jgi:two-component system NarL family response regulator
MPELNGVDAARQIGHEHPRMRVVALSTHTDERFVRMMLEAGAHGYVTKEAAGTELVRAIRQVCQGRKYLSSDVTGDVVEGYIQRDPEEAAGHAPLGGREREVLQLIAEGATSGEIAARLHLSTNTVDTHRRNIMKKLDLHSIADLTKFAIREGLTDVER